MRTPPVLNHVPWSRHSLKDIWNKCDEEFFFTTLYMYNSLGAYLNLDLFYKFLCLMRIRKNLYL